MSRSRPRSPLRPSVNRSRSDCVSSEAQTRRTRRSTGPRAAAARGFAGPSLIVVDAGAGLQIEEHLTPLWGESPPVVVAPTGPIIASPGQLTCTAGDLQGRITPTDVAVRIIGVGLASHDQNEASGNLAQRNDPPALPDTAEMPLWDPVLRRLIYRGTVVKVFGQRSDNQEAVLNALEKAGWPSWIRSPFRRMRHDDVLPGDRLHNTVKRLNRQLNSLIHFSCDGTGTGILWKALNP